MSAIFVSLAVVWAGCAAAQAPPQPGGTLRGEVAFAASPAPTDSAAAPGPAAGCPKPCYVVKDYYPYRTCKAECDPATCNRNYGVWQSSELCCAPGTAFPEGCSARPKACWVAESFNLRTCVRDDRKCLQGYGVFADEATCCAPGAAFPEGCAANLTLSREPCYVVDSYFPARTCRPTHVACDKRGQTWPTAAACCAPQSGAFGEGCSTYVPSAPCWVIDSYDPVRRCRRDADVATCFRGWGVYQSEEVCCTPGAAFSEGCSQQPPASPAAAPAGAAAAPPASGR